MNEGLIPRRYAKALYEVALENHADARLYELMKRLSASFDSQPGLSEVLSNPYVSDADKSMLLTTASGAEAGDSLFKDLLKLLSKNRRMDMARGIALAYVELYRQSNRIYEVKVTSASPMSDEENERLYKMIERHLNGGTMEFTHTVDPSLIGGFTVSVGNERIDASVSNELKQLRLNLITK